jgi:hypothetical protein
MFFDIIESSPLEFTSYMTSVRDALSMIDGFYEISPPSALDRAIYGFFKVYDMRSSPVITVEELKEEMPCVERFSLKTPIRITLPTANYFMSLVSAEDFSNAAVLALLPDRDEFQNLMLFTISAAPMNAWNQFLNLDLAVRAKAHNPPVSPISRNIPDKFGSLFVISYLQTLSYLERGMYSLLPV